jgi:hypothetical protein
MPTPLHRQCRLEVVGGRAKPGHDNWGMTVPLVPRQLGNDRAACPATMGQ